ncbi:ribonuclease P protein component [Candidatus Finniella inopinata]|uniref:Ribonuclease P protein component n=1 Tax=Candidatus Finniella inopinata TaxID=1696036 RepID=A0A4Q7DIT1_9PROT|nr:ribonuclease P protein component [Candidatus Finniella inopinata]RZI46208.1 ribonuclease P protein component [Candidatus Finniella inopinata]
MALSRLKKRADFLRVAKTKVVAKTSTMLIQCTPAIDVALAEQIQPKHLRVGFTASRRVGNAVKRNRAKRRLRALADMHLEKKVLETIDPSTGDSFEFVFIAIPGTVNADFPQLSKDFIKGVRWCLSRFQPRPIAFEPQEEKTDVKLSC